MTLGAEPGDQRTWGDRDLGLLGRSWGGGGGTQDPWKVGAGGSGLLGGKAGDPELLGV